jgi:hypothetical protein
MSEFQDVIAQIDKAGITIEGREQFIKNAEATQDWPAAVTEMAFAGRKDGIRLIRKADDAPGNQQIDQILRGNPFTFEQRDLITQNVITAV